MQSGDRDAVEGGTNAFSCPDPKATPARAKHQALQAWVRSLRVPTPVSPSPGNVPPPQLCPLPSSVSSASSPQRRGGQAPRSGRTPEFSTLQAQLGPRHIRPQTEHDAGAASVQLPPPTPWPREGSEGLAASCTAAAADCSPSAGTSPPLTPSFLSRLGGACPHLPVPNWETLGQALGQLEKGQDNVQTSLHSTRGWVQPRFGGSRRGQHQCSPRLTHLSPWPGLPPHAGGLQRPMGEAPPRHSPPGSGGAQSRSLSFSGGQWRSAVTQTFPRPIPASCSPQPSLSPLGNSILHPDCLLGPHTWTGETEDQGR